MLPYAKLAAKERYGASFVTVQGCDNNVHHFIRNLDGTASFGFDAMAAAVHVDALDMEAGGVCFWEADRFHFVTVLNAFFTAASRLLYSFV